MNKLVWLLKLLLVAFGIFCGVALINGIFQVVYTTVTASPTFLKASLPEYDQLFGDSQRGKLHVEITTKTNTRPPESGYIYDHKYHVYVFRLNLAANTSLKNIIRTENEISREPFMEVNSESRGYKCIMHDKMGKQDPVKTLDFRYSGGVLVPVAANDTLFCYNYRFKTFSLSYNNAPWDMVARADDNATPAASIAFIRKAKKLYVVLLTPTEAAGDAIAPDLLYTMIKK